MSRSRTRTTSRTLIALLIGVIALGAVFYLHNPEDSQATVSSEETTAKSIVPPAQPAATEAPTPMPGLAEARAAVKNSPVAPVAAKTTPDVKPVVLAEKPSITITPTTKPATQPAAAPAPKPTAGAVLAGSSASPLIEAQTRLHSNDFLGARRVANEALQSGRLSPQDTEAAKGLISQANQTLVFSPRRFSDDPFGGSHTVQSGERLAKIAADNHITWEFLGRINGISDPRKMRVGQTLKLVKGPFHAVVSKSTFKMDLYLGGLPGDPNATYVTTLPVGLGKDDSTPPGTWRVEPSKKLKNPVYYSPRGEGVILADDPKNPLGEYWIGLEGIEGEAKGKASYGIHGTIEPDSIGKMESMGCIRMRNEDVGMVYEMLVEGQSLVMVKP